MGLRGSGICASAPRSSRVWSWRTEESGHARPAPKNTKGTPHECRDPSPAQPPRRRPGPGRFPTGQGPLQDREGFAPEYFSRLDAEDLAERTPEDLLGALLSHLQLGEVRKPGQPKLRIFSPTPGEDGWWSRHSVIQVVNDDMPFLVDSTSLEINRQGLTLHLMVHPIYAVKRDAKGRLESIGAPHQALPGAARESWMHIEIDRLIDAEQRDALAAGIERVLGDVRAAVATGSPCSPGCTTRSRNSSAPRLRCRRPSWPKAARSCSGWPTTT